MQMFTGNYIQGLCGEIGVREFQIYGDCMYTRNPCNFEFSALPFIIFAGNLILQGFYGDSLH